VLEHLTELAELGWLVSRLSSVGRRRSNSGGELMIFDLCTGQRLTTLIGHTKPVTAVACTQLDGTPIAVSAAGDYIHGGGEVMVWDLRTGLQRTTLIGHTKPVRAVACTQLDGTPIAITGAGYYGHGGGEVMIWDLRTGRLQQSFAMPYPVGSLACDPNNGVVVGTATEVVRLECAHSC